MRITKACSERLLYKVLTRLAVKAEVHDNYYHYGKYVAEHLYISISITSRCLVIFCWPSRKAPAKILHPFATLLASCGLFRWLIGEVNSLVNIRGWQGLLAPDAKQPRTKRFGGCCSHI